MKVRSISEIIESFRQSLKLTKSSLSNFTDYSNVYALFRSVASVISKQESELTTIKQSLFISTATGSDLDDKGFEYGLVRYKGNFSTGYVLISGSSSANLKIPSKTILSTANKSIQFETQQDVTLNSGSGNEVSIPIISLINSTEANLSAGTKLYSNLFPNLSFVVGKFRNSLTKNIEGSLTNGSDLESDIDFRYRISNYLNTRSKSTKESILDEIINSSLSITKVLIKEHVPVTGYFTIYVDSQDINILKQVEIIVERNRAAGVCGLVKPLTFLPIIISLEVYIKSSQNADAILKTVKQTVNNYIQSLQPNQTMYRESLAGSVLKIPEVVNCKVIRPTNDILTKKEQIITIDNIQVSINLGNR